MTARELSDAERAAMERRIQLAWNEYSQICELANDDGSIDPLGAMRAGYRAALAAREEPPAISVAMVERAAKAAHEAEREKYLAAGEPGTEPWDQCVADASLWGGENFTLDEVLGFHRAALEAALADDREAGELPGDAQRRSLVDADLDPTEPQELKDAFRIMRHLMCSRGGEQLVLDRVIRPYGLTVVRDTEREHEPADDAEHIVIGDSSVTLCGQAKTDLNCVPLSSTVPGWGSGCWTCLTLAREAWEASVKPHREHAEVLAKALDRFFREAEHHLVLGQVGEVEQLKREVLPTLRALGYPKEET